VLRAGLRRPSVQKDIRSLRHTLDGVDGVPRPCPAPRAPALQNAGLARVPSNSNAIQFGVT
jgi:hypothetical protein